MDSFSNFASPLVIEMIGVSGFVLYVTNYALLTFRVLNTYHIAYFVINLCAASLVLIGLSASFNLAAAMIQFFWIAMSILAIAMRLYSRSSYRIKSS